MSNIQRLLYRFIFAVLIIFLITFLPAGRWDYWQGWLFFALSMVFFFLMAYLFSSNEDLVNERLKPGPGVKWWDKVFMAVYQPMHLAIIVIGSLDTGRFGWSQHFPPWLYGLGIILQMAAFGMFAWTMSVNRFFSSQMRIQLDRGHYVIDSGPYSIVRHPGYLAGIALVIGTALVFGSYYALIPASILVPMFILRTCLEDKTLKQELNGYQEYAQTVRYRFIPGIW